MLNEIKSFIEVNLLRKLNFSNVFNAFTISPKADNVVKVVDVNNVSLIIPHRLSSANMPPLEKGITSHLVLHEIIIVGNCAEQVSFKIFFLFKIFF